MALAPLRFGAVEDWVWSGFCVLVALLGALWAASVIGGLSPLSIHPKVLWKPLLALFLVLLWASFQLSELSSSFAHPIWAIAGAQLGEDITARIALDPWEGRTVLMRWLAYALIFWLALQYGRNERLAKAMLYSLVIATSLYAGLGLLFWMLDLEQLWVLTRSQVEGRLALPFINPNNLGAYLAMGLLVAVGLVFSKLKGLWGASTPWRERGRRLLGEHFPRFWPLWMALVLLAAGLLLTQSRGAVLSALAGLFVFFAVMVAVRKLSRRVGLVSFGALVVLLSLAFASLTAKTLERFAQIEEHSEKRIEIYDNTLEAIAASPWTGYGLGSFRPLYRYYDRGDSRVVVTRAHSTLLETPLDLGIPAALLLFSAFFWGACRLLTGAWGRQRDAEIPAVGLAVLIQMTLHSAVEFPLQIPAIAFAFMALTGVALAQSWSSMDDLSKG